MKSWYLWVGLALIALVLLSIREGFVATATIKNPNTWDAAELTRIKGLVSPASTLSDAEIRSVVGGFWGAWEAATSRITTADLTEYVDGITRGNPAAALKRGAYQDLLRAYYIQQGESVFREASGYSTGTSESESSSSSSSSDTASTTTVERPSTSTQSLRQDIATTYGIPTSSSAAIDFVVGKVQSFYDTVYLPDKTAPTYTQITGFADGIDTATVPTLIQNNFKVHLISVLQTYFTPASGTSVTPASSSRTGGADVGAAGSAEGGAEGGQGLSGGKNVQGPESGGIGTSNTTGGLGVPRTYPVLYGGEQQYSSALPSSASLGSDPTAKYLPYSRVPGDQDLYPDPYRLGKYFSSSSYSDKNAPDPAPFLADFSKFLT